MDSDRTVCLSSKDIIHEVLEVCKHALGGHSILTNIVLKVQMQTAQRSKNFVMKNIQLQYFYGLDVHQVPDVVDLPSDVMIRRDPFVFPIALLR
jgi:hypothetical protein